MYGRIHDPVMRIYSSRGAAGPKGPRVGVSTPCGAVSTRETAVFVAGLLELYMYGRNHGPGMVPYPPRVPLALRTPGWRFYTVRGGIDPADDRFCPRFVGFVCMEEVLFRGWKLILPGWRWLYERRVEISTQRGAVSTRRTTVFVHGLLEIQMYGSIYDPRMGPYPRWVALAHAGSMSGIIPLPHQPSRKSQ